MNSHNKTIYYKITNKEENHNGYQYKTGLNILDKSFEENGSCVSGGLYFTDINHIFDFLAYGCYLREIMLPLDDPEFKMIKDGDNKWRANKIILGERRELASIKTYEYLVKMGADIQTTADGILVKAAESGDLDLVKCIMERGANVGAYDYFAFLSAVKCGDLDIVKYLVEKITDTSVLNNGLKVASVNGCLDMARYLVELGADIHVDDDYCVGMAAQNGHLDVVSYLVEIGADIHACDNYPLKQACEGFFEIVKYLVENGADVQVDNNYPLRAAVYCNNLEIMKYLVENGADLCVNNGLLLRIAIFNNCWEIVDYLVEKGVAVSATSREPLELPNF